MSDDRITASIQRELTRLVGLAQLARDTPAVEALLRAKTEIARAAA